VIFLFSQLHEVSAMRTVFMLVRWVLDFHSFGNRMVILTRPAAASQADHQGPSHTSSA